MLQQKRGVRICERNMHTQISGEGGEGAAPGIRAEVPLQPMVQPMARQLSPCRHGGAQDAEIHLQPMQDPHQSTWMSKGGCDSMGSPHLNMVLAGPVAPWREEPLLEQVCWPDSLGDLCWSSLCLKDCIPWKGPVPTCRGLIPVGEVPPGAGLSHVRGRSSTQSM
ncbi:hypothetical protein DUI87_24983 [Hirundo rustica rustica]|uniref:Uncharacterized protein n=1 Tax=Hirundo rustica rustica TaxID=333673 RepID=A0A3M0JD75_HIRRU|nr:hypothetical protein DUI87_24983 [Hirundo rustica rustica]